VISHTPVQAEHHALYRWPGDTVSSTDTGWRSVVNILTQWPYCWKYNHVYGMDTLTITKIHAHDTNQTLPGIPAHYNFTDR
jgi:hypothetical protein